MKKSIPIIFLLTLFLLPSVFAVEITLNENYSQGETLLAKVSGSFVSPLVKENVLFYKEHTRIPMEYGVNRIDGEYYVYALLTGKSKGNYSISIENAQYKKGEEITDEKIVKNFSITDKLADFSVNPGFVSASGDFSIKIKNLQENKITVDVKTDLDDSKGREIFISPELSKEAFIQVVSGAEKKIDFKLSSSGSAVFRKIRLQTSNITYEIPVSISATSEEIQGQSTTFSLEPSKFTYSLPTNSEVKKTVYLYNTGSSDIGNISISLSNSLNSVASVSVTKIEKLNAGANVQFELTFNSKTEADVEGELRAGTGEITSYSSISLKFLNNYVAPAIQVSGQSSAKTCAELEGINCNKEGFKCSKEPIEAKDTAACCKGTCDAVATGSSGRIIAIVLVVLVIGGVVWFYFKKFKKAKKPIDLLEISKVKEV